MGQLVHLHRVERHQSRYISWPGCIFIEWKDIKEDTFRGKSASSSSGKTSKQIHFVARMHLHRVERHQSRYISWPGCIFIEWKDIKADTFCGQGASSSRGKASKKIHFVARVHLHRVEKASKKIHFAARVHLHRGEKFKSRYVQLQITRKSLR